MSQLIPTWNELTVPEHLTHPGIYTTQALTHPGIYPMSPLQDLSPTHKELCFCHQTMGCGDIPQSMSLPVLWPFWPRLIPPTVTWYRCSALCPVSCPTPSVSSLLVPKSRQWWLQLHLSNLRLGLWGEGYGGRKGEKQQSLPSRSQVVAQPPANSPSPDPNPGRTRELS